jgi:hypothetical protein
LLAGNKNGGTKIFDFFTPQLHKQLENRSILLRRLFSLLKVLSSPLVFAAGCFRRRSIKSTILIKTSRQTTRT